MNRIYNFEMFEKNWIKDAIKKPGGLHKDLGVEEDEKIPAKKINDKIKSLHNKKEREGDLSAKDSKTLKRLNLSKTLKKL